MYEVIIHELDDLDLTRNGRISILAAVLEVDGTDYDLAQKLVARGCYKDIWELEDSSDWDRAEKLLDSSEEPLFSILADLLEEGYGKAYIGYSVDASPDAHQFVFKHEATAARWAADLRNSTYHLQVSVRKVGKS